VNNYLRVAGRELNMDVRSFGGMMQSQTAPNPIKPFVGQIVLAAYGNDHDAFNKALKMAVSEAMHETDVKGKPLDKAEAMKLIISRYEAQNPLKIVFGSPKTEAEIQKLTAQLPDSGKQSVNQALQLFQHYGAQIGADRSVYARDKSSAGPMLPPMSFNDMRSSAINAGRF